MKSWTAVLLLAFVAVASATVDRSPLVAWSNGHMFTDGQQYTREYADSVDVSSMVRATVGQRTSLSSFTQYFDVNSAPEMSVLIVAPSSIELSGQQSLKAAAESTQSLVVPAVYQSEDIFEAVSRLAGTTFAGAEVDSAIEAISRKEYENGAADLLVMDLQDLSATEVDHTVAKLTAALAGQSFTALFTSNSASSGEDLDMAPSRAAYLPMRIAGEDQDSYDTYWPSYVVEMIVTSALLLFITIVGFFCTTKIQTPDQWEQKEKKTSSIIM